MHLLHHMHVSLALCTVVLHQHLGSPTVACMCSPSQRALQRPCLLVPSTLAGNHRAATPFWLIHTQLKVGILDCAGLR